MKNKQGNTIIKGKRKMIHAPHTFGDKDVAYRFQGISKENNKFSYMYYPHELPNEEREFLQNNA